MKTKLWLVLAVAAAWVWLMPQPAMAGACTAARFHDWFKTCPLYAGAGNAPAPSVCSDCTTPPPLHGMPSWWVTEPNINLGVVDTPLSYTMASGQALDFTFYYKQRARLPAPDESPIDPNFLGSVELGFTEIHNGYPLGATCGSDASWGHNWNQSVILKTMGANNHVPSFSQGYYAWVLNTDGSIDNYSNVDYLASGIPCKDPQSQTILTDVAGDNYPQVWEVMGIQITNTPAADTNGIYWGDPNVGVKLIHPDGSQDIFGLSPYFVQEIYADYNTNAYIRLLLTQRIDPQGRVFRLGYEQKSTVFGGYFDRVKYLVDPDGRTNQFWYAATTNSQVSEIDDPYGRKTLLSYDAFGQLSSIVDAVQMTNSFTYGTNQVIQMAVWCVTSDTNDPPYVCGYNDVSVAGNGWMSQLTTQYGTTKFFHYEVDETNEPDGVQERGLYINEPEGAAQLYYYRHTTESVGIPSSATAPVVPGITNFDDDIAGGVSGHYALYYRNSFHWGRRQFAAANSSVQNSLLLASQAANASAADGYIAAGLTNLAASDFALARMRHWLWLSDGVSISGSLSSERAPAFDSGGQSPGIRTWYDYLNKPANGAEELGNDPQISCIAKVLPDGTSQYTTYNFYPTNSPGAGLVSDNESTYTQPAGSAGLLTNWFAYASNNIDLLSQSNSAGQDVNYSYNTNHQILAATNALNQVVNLSWDALTHNLTNVQAASGQSLSAGYYAPATPASSTSSLLHWVTLQPEGRTFTNNNYSAGSPSSVTDDRGVTVSQTWDGLNRLTGIGFPDGTSISNIYNRLDLVAAKDRLANWTYYAYDGLQHLTNVINANGAATAYSWCGCGSLSEIFDAQNGTTFPTYLNYDNQGNLTNVIFPDSSSLTYQLDLAARVAKVLDGAGRYRQFAYNLQGLVTNIASANGSLRTATYDALNRPLAVTDANGVTVTNSYDAINELVKRTWPDGIGESYGYSAAGLIAYTNRDGQAVYYNLDPAGRRIAETNANLEVTRFAYDSLDNITDLWDGNTNHTQFQFNEYGWLTNKLDGLGRNAFRYSYNANGWVTNRWTPEKGNTGYTYDNVGNRKSILYPLSSILYAFDALNRLTNMVDALGSHTFGWTAGSQLASESDAWTTNSWSYTQRLRTQMTITQPGGNWTQSYGYDAGWRLQTLTSPAGTFGYSYNFQPASALVTGIALPNGANIVNGYDSLARLTGTALNNYWGHTLDGYAYTPDPLGLRTNIVRNLGLTTNSVSVGYDNIAQITAWNAKETSGVLRQNEQLGFGYDPAHNLHSRNNGNLSQTFTTDAANQLNSVSRAGTFTLSGATPAPATTVTVNGQAAQMYGDFTFAATNLSLANGNNTFTVIATNIYGMKATNALTVNLPQGVTLSFDNNGNLTNDGAKTFGFDAENQLTNVTSAGAWKSDYVYDGLNRRRIARDFSWSGSTWVLTNEVHFIYDGNLVIQERDTNNNVLVTYTRGLDLSGSLQGAGGIGGLLARTDTNGSTFYHADANGNIAALMDGSENIVARYLYGPFGKLVGQWGPMANANEMQFSSMPWHDGILFLPRRPYLADIGRFATQDPIQERGGINLYRFVENNPVNFVDPFGLADNSDDEDAADRMLNRLDNGNYSQGGDRWTPQETQQAGKDTAHVGKEAAMILANGATAGVGEIGELGEGIDAAKVTKDASGDIHHVATVKNCVSTARGGPWTPRFADLFKKAGMTLEDNANKVKVFGHVGPHPEEYHQAVFDRLISATSGLSGDAYTQAFKAELAAIRSEVATSGSYLNKLVTGAQ